MFQSSDNGVKVATDFKWENGGTAVVVSGSFNEWKEVTLSQE